MSQTLNILLVYAHPEAHYSVANRALLRAVQGLSHVTLHDLYAHYPDFFIDINLERHLLATHQVIVFQHPLYTYSCPALLKEWFDRVISRGFINSAGETLLSGKYWRSVITTGDPATAYRHDGQHRTTLAEILCPLTLTARLCQMHWMSPIVVYAARHIAPEKLERYVQAYREWLTAPLAVGNLNGAY